MQFSEDYEIRQKSLTYCQNNGQDEYQDYYGMRQKSSTSINQTKVLLVCVYNKNGTPIPHDLYYKLFQQYGTVNKILIFQKAKVWKTFIEMDTIKDAIKAKHSLNDFIIFNDGSKMNIFFSNLDQLNLQNQNSSGGIDYNLIQQQQQFQVQQTQIQLPQIDLTKNDTELTEHVNHLNSSLQRLDQIMQVNTEQQQQQQSRKDQTIYFNPSFIEENKESPVLYCRGLESNEIQIEYISTLFLNFGNITQILRIQTKFAALIEFEHVNFAIQAKDFLNNTYFFGKQLKIFFSNYITIKDRKQKHQREEILFVDSKLYKYKQNTQNLNINPPSNILHLSNLKKESCDANMICKLFEDIANPISIKLIEKNSKFMVLVQFLSQEESFKAMVMRQGCEVLGRRLLISFTKSKM